MRKCYNPAGLVIQEADLEKVPSCGAVLNDQGGERLSIEKSELSPTLRSETHGNLPIVAVSLPISTQLAMRGETDNDRTGFGVGDEGDPSFTLTRGHCHAVGVHLSYEGKVNTSPMAYSLTTNGTATGRNGPLVCENLKAFSLDGDSSNSMRSKNPLSGCRETETARTIDTTNPCPSKNQGGLAVVEGASLLDEIAAENQEARITNVHPKIVGTLVASASGLSRPGGMGSETDLCIAYCLQGNMIGRQDHNGPRGSGINKDVAFTITSTDVNGVTAPASCDSTPVIYQDVIGALCNGDHKGIGNQYVSQCKCIVAKPCSCNKKAFTSSSYGGLKEGIGTLKAHGGDNGGGSETLIISEPPPCYIVRRLLPVECERLQGYPDGWTQYGHDGKEISDTRRYQMLGNSVAVNVVAYIMLGIMEQFQKGVEVAEEAHL